MHYEYQHAGLERSQPHQSEQNLIKGMDVRTALDRSGFGNKSNVEKSQKFNDVQNGKQSGSFVKSSGLNGNIGMERNSALKSNFSGYNEVQRSGFKEENLLSAFEGKERQQSDIKISNFGGSRRQEVQERNHELERSEVRRYDQSGMRHNQQEYGVMKGSEFGQPRNSEYRGGAMQGSTFVGARQLDHDSRNPRQSGYRNDTFSRNQQFQMSSMKPSNFGQNSSFKLSESSRMQPNSSFKSSSFNKPENKRGGVEDMLESFHQEEGYYNTLDIINFLFHYQAAEESPEEIFLRQQIHRNMRTTFTGKYVPSQLQDLATHGRYFPPEGPLDEQERKVLYNIYLEYLKDNGRQFQLSNEQKLQQFERVLKNSR